jgi:hypothetical protein
MNGDTSRIVPEAQKPTKRIIAEPVPRPSPTHRATVFVLIKMLQFGRNCALSRRPLTGELLDLGLLESDVLLGDGIVFLEAEFVGLGARVLLGYVEIARVGTRLEFDLDHVALGHNTISLGSSNALLAVFAL